MSFSTVMRLAALSAALCISGPATAQPSTAAPDSGATFQCQDGSKMTLAFAETGSGLAAVVSVHGASYRLDYQEPEPGPVQVVWSDGDHSLTWSPGVQLMWMAANTHLMCGRGGHKH